MARARPRIPTPTVAGVRARLARVWYPREFLFVICFLGALGMGGVWGMWKNLCAGDACPSIAQISTFEHEQKSKILAVDGRQIAEIGFESRTPVSIRALPPYVAEAVIATEDKRFYQHRGVDVRAILRAVPSASRAPRSGY